MVAAAAVSGAGAVLATHATAAHDEPQRVRMSQALDIRDLPVPVPIRRHVFHGPALSTPVPVLMYHVIGTPPPSAPYPDLFVSRQLFAAQITALARAGYQAITLDRMWQAWHGRATLPHRPIVLTFDDGYRGDFGAAMPILRRRHWPGVLNLLVANLHRHGWGIKTWMVQRMIRSGWEVDSHTLTHPDLTTLSPQQLWNEVHGARVVLRRLFHVPVRFFCYPAGAYDSAVIAAVQRAGYLGATTELPGLARRSAPFTLARVRVDGGELPATLIQTIRQS
ncbi:MAG TPA: polysaccharide deacetylase family protein [Gaiellales bacterium]|nr:polysaccharide deacetylase family protein [Gaiellales bacterium]